MVIAEDVARLEPMLVGDIEGAFYVPDYQRGYRWGAVEVERLLDDLDASGGEPYYLQPIVVKARPDGSWELVDGQQRLTTLHLLLRYMQKESLQSMGPAFSLEYETRRASADYLGDPDESHSQDNIDFFHIFEAFRSIGLWFDAKGNRRQHIANKLYGYLFESVQVIWYEAPSAMDSSTLFTRLNIGRIPLTDAELVKAQLLSISVTAPGHTSRSHEIAARWDSIERELRNPELWAFATGRSAGVPTHISLLLDTLADLHTGEHLGRERPLFHTFETLRPLIETSAYDLWERVVDLHALVAGWYKNRDLFHRVGFLTANGYTLFQLVRLAEGSTKTEFELALTERIRDALAITQSQLEDLDYRNKRASAALLLMNVETVRRMKHSAERYSFAAHASGSWSLEHIHAQNAEKLNRADQWSEWLQLHRSALKGLPESVLEPVARDELVARIDTALPTITEASFRPLEREVIECLSGTARSAPSDIDSISNLALLSAGDNSALSNSVFEVKRQEILKRDFAGSFIPVCTRNVFLKYYTDSAGQQVHFWGDLDRAAYVDALREVLDPYLTPETERSAG